MTTTFPVCTTSKDWHIEVVGMGEAPRIREGKAAPSGEATYASGCILRVARKDGVIKADKTASIHVIQPAAIYELGVLYEAAGRVYVQPYLTGGGDSARLAYSITCERLVPVQGGAAPRGAKGDE